MFYFGGLGLYDERDISDKGVEALKKGGATIIPPEDVYDW